MSTANAPKRIRQRGQALVESALTLTIFIAVMIGVIDFGQIIYAQQTLVERARAGVRYAALRPTDITGARNVTVFNTASPTSSTVPFMTGLTTAMVSVTTSGIGTDTGTVTLTISGYPLQMITPGFNRNMTARTVSLTMPAESAM